jgi:hypothetical protein
MRQLIIFTNTDHGCARIPSLFTRSHVLNGKMNSFIFYLQYEYILLNANTFLLNIPKIDSLKKTHKTILRIHLYFRINEFTRKARFKASDHKYGRL